ncbi:MAG: PSD1 domain-containing protein [Acidobacteria bacterium]|nr:PSD1 domain-containing protein [Acidobacteriota bacterium]
MSAYIRTRKLLLVAVIAGLAAAALLSNRQISAQGNVIRFNRDIRPIFADTCYRCHGPDKNARKAGLRLDIRQEAIKKTRSGVTPIVPGKPDESEIIRRIFSTDKSELMPPEEIHKELTAAQKELIRRWVAEGAKYEGHWAYQPIARSAVPEIRNPQSAIRNPIDAFIQARLAKEGLSPAPEADRRTLIRRVSLDLTGIPPTSAEIAAFIADKSPDAYEKLVDRLLGSPRYAEKQTMHWLDAVRYADTSGFHGDNAYPTWPYRDYVLRSFLENKPFDQFTREQIAGDLLPNATTEQKVASAYNRLNRVSAEGGLQPKEYLAKYAADRVRTTSIVWLGATMGCAECHDHKFDPYLSKDFYSMKAFFADIKETGLVPDRGRNAWGSKLELPTEAQKRQFDKLTQDLDWAQTELDEQAEKLNARRAAWEQQTLQEFEAGKLAWQFQTPISASSTGGTTLTIYNDQPLVVTQYRGGNIVSEEIKGDGLVVASGENSDNATYTVSFKPGAGEWTALGIEVVQDESLPANRVARGADRFVLTEVDTSVGRTPLSFVLATTDRAGEWPENHPMNAIDGNAKTGWGMSFADGRGAFIALRLAQKLKTDAESVVTVRLHHDSELRRATIGRFRLALSSAEYSWPDHQAKSSRPMNGLPFEIAAALKESPDKRTDAQNKQLQSFFQWTASELQPLTIRVAKLEAERDLLDSQIPRVMITETMTPAETRILPRGNFLDESGQVVNPAIPMMFNAAAAAKPEANERRLTRLDLANWIVSKENPLTARVFVNRLWREFFGVGISKTLDDLGSQGEWPTHPELLDWLASEFLHPSDCGLRIADCGKTQPHDWDVKHIIRLIVTSHTYRQSSNPQTAPIESKQENPQSIIHNPHSADPDNRLLAHQNRFRMDAEIVRDIALSVSGLLVEKFGGPSIKPVQPERYLATLNFPVRDYSEERGENLYRRGVYVHWQRTFLHPSLSTFDAPSREECTVNRTNSNTPLQALVLLNDPIFVEAARVFAQNALQHGGLTPTSQIAWAFERATGRKPTSEEMRVLSELHQKSLAGFLRDPKSARELASVGDAPTPKGLASAKLAAMITVTRAILNLHETITRN